MNPSTSTDKHADVVGVNLWCCFEQLERHHDEYGPRRQPGHPGAVRQIFDNPGQQLAVPGIRAGCLDGLLDVGELFGIGRDEGQDGGFKLAVVVSSEIR